MSDAGANSVVDVDKVLEERGKSYGSFKLHAQITQSLMDACERHMKAHNPARNLTPSQRECLHMIMHKIGRIVNGDPNYADSWVDIAGYAMLVADELQQDEEFRRK